MCEGSGSGGLTVGWRVSTFPFLDGDVVNGDVSLDAGPTDSLYQHLTGNHLSVVKLASGDQLTEHEDFSRSRSLFIPERLRLAGC